MSPPFPFPFPFPLPSPSSSSSSPSLLLLLLLTAAPPRSLRWVAGHVRMECPPPLSGETGVKTGPCDVRSDDGSMPSFPLRPNALNTITWLESIGHPGAPARFALSRDGIALDGDGGLETCILLDHVPHDARSKPKFVDESTWHRSGITLWIPDVKCDRCYLQLVSVMTDAPHGVPAGSTCAYEASAAATAGDHPPCPAVYHSCAPVSIDGSVPRNDLEVCDTAGFEERLGWPATPGRDAGLYGRSTYLNRGDVGLYDPADKRLRSFGEPLTDATCASWSHCDPDVSFAEVLAVPDGAAYAAPEGSCASILEAPVEPYRRPDGMPLGAATAAAPRPPADAIPEEPDTASGGEEGSAATGTAPRRLSSVCAAAVTMVILEGLSL